MGPQRRSLPHHRQKDGSSLSGGVQRRSKTPGEPHAAPAATEAKQDIGRNGGERPQTGIGLQESDHLVAERREGGERPQKTHRPQGLPLRRQLRAAPEPRREKAQQKRPQHIDRKRPPRERGAQPKAQLTLNRKTSHRAQRPSCSHRHQHCPRYRHSFSPVEVARFGTVRATGVPWLLRANPQACATPVFPSIVL